MAEQFPPDDDFLYRRARGDQITPLDGGGYKGSTGLFKSSGGPLSFDLASLTTAELVRDQAKNGQFHVVRIPISVLRAQGCRIVLEPENDNAAHVHVYGSRPDGSLSGGQASRCADGSTVVLVNPNAALPLAD